MLFAAVKKNKCDNSGRIVRTFFPSSGQQASMPSSAAWGKTRSASLEVIARRSHTALPHGVTFDAGGQAKRLNVLQKA